jgi:hypothetical protein
MAILRANLHLDKERGIYLSTVTFFLPKTKGKTLKEIDRT